MDYIIFVLGYDLLQDFFASCEDAPCDSVYSACCLIAGKFALYDMDNPTDSSEYEALRTWLDNNMDFVREACKIWNIK